MYYTDNKKIKNNASQAFSTELGMILFGKRIGIFVRRVLSSAFASLYCAATLAQTTVTPDGGNTATYLADNGVPVVDIATPNGSGLSHNRYTRFDIENNGLVLNNGDLSQIERQSVLAGRVFANPNLRPGQEAGLILNEVTSTNRSALAGFLEVLGGKADVVVANPNGLTCTGCGFINTDRVTLTTGTPNLVGGSLSGFNVNQGDILINGAGANLSTQDIFDLVAGKVKIDGRINTKPDGKLKIATGKQFWNYINRTSQNNTPDTSSGFAFDSTALGGMYAGRIEIITNDKGAGVRMLGQAAASDQDFVLTSAGKIEIQSSISAQRDVQLTSTSATGESDILVVDPAQISANRNLEIAANAGEVQLSESTLYAGNDLTLTAGSLDDSASNSNTRYADDNNTLTIQNAASITGANWGAGDTFSGTFGDLTLGNTQSKLYASAALSLTATTQDLALGTGGVRGGSVSLAATQGSVSTEAATGQGVEATSGDLNITAGNAIVNAGLMMARTGNTTVRSNRTFSNSGSVYAQNILDIGSSSSNAAVTNSGLLIAEGQLRVNAQRLDNTASGRITGNGIVIATTAGLTNAGVVQGSNAPSTINVGSLLDNDGTLTVTASATEVDTSSSISAERIENSGRIQAADSLEVRTATLANQTAAAGSDSNTITSGKNLTIKVSGATLGNAGEITAGGNLHIQKVGSTASLDLTNEANARLQAGATLRVDGEDTATNAAIVFSNAANAKVLGDALLFRINRLSNAGVLQGGSGASNINTNGVLNHTGVITLATSAAGSGTIEAQGISNSGRIQSSGDARLVSTDDIDNTGVLHATGNLNLQATSGVITNRDLVFAEGQLRVNAQRLDNTASGRITGNGMVIATTAGLTNAGTVQGSNAPSTINVGSLLDNDGTLTVTASATEADKSSSISAERIENSGRVQAADSLEVRTATLANQAAAAGSDSNTITSGKNLTIKASGATLGNAGEITAGGNLHIQKVGSTASLALTNEANARLQAGATLRVDGEDTATNAAIVFSNAANAKVLGDALLFRINRLSNAGVLQGGSGASSINMGGALNNTGTITLATSTTGSGTIEAQGISNSGRIQSSGNARLVSTDDIDNSGVLHAVGNLELNTTDRITNSDLVLAEGQLRVSAQSLNNTASGKATGDGVAITTTGDFTNAGVVQGSDERSTITVGGLLDNDGTLTVTASATEADTSSSISAERIENSGRIQAADSLEVRAATLANQTAAAGSDSSTITSGKNLTIKVSGATLDNAGEITAGGNLHIQKVGSAASLALTNEANARLQAGATLRVDGEDAAANAAIVFSNAANAKVLGDALLFRINRLSNTGVLQGGSGASNINTNGVLNHTGVITLATSAAGSGTIEAQGISNSGRIQSSGDARLVSTDDIDNSSVLHAAGNLDLRATNAVLNTNTGGISSLNVLTITADTGGITNQGAFYAQDTLRANALQGTITNDTTGTMDAGNDIFISAKDFVNKNIIRAGRDIVINVGDTFRNITPSAYSITSSTVTRGPTQIGHRPKGYLFGGVDHYEEFDFEEIETTTQQYDGGAPQKPQIISGGNLTISGFDTGENTGGLLSARGTMTLTGGAPGSTFTNNPLDLIETTQRRTYTRQTRYAALGPAVFYRDRIINDVTTTTESVQPGSIGAGITAATLTASGFTLDNKGSPSTPTVSASTATVTPESTSGTTGAQGVAAITTSADGEVLPSTTRVQGVTAITTSAESLIQPGTVRVENTQEITFPGLDINLPSNPNGFFVIAQDPTAEFLVETNPLFAIGSFNAIGSDYLQEHYGYDPDTVVKRLGDANYEAYLIKQQLIAQTGSNTLTVGASEVEQVQQLMNNALEQSEGLGLIYGQELNQEQINGLTQDIVWMVIIEVEGQEVLAPVVYLSPSTKQGIQKGAVIAAKNIDARLEALTNTGGNITATERLAAQTTEDIENISGSIRGGEVNLTSTQGSIRNTTTVVGSGDDTRFVTDIGKTAEISSGGNLTLGAAKNIEVKGSTVKAQGDASLSAGDAITFDTIVDKTTQSSFIANGVSLLDRKSERENITTKENIEASLTSGGDLDLSSGGDITVAGSTVTVGEDISVDTQGGFSVSSVQDTTTTKSTTVTSGAGVGGGAVGTETKVVESFTGENVASGLTVGGSANIDAQKTITVQGSSIDIAGNAALDADNIEVLDGLDEQSSTTTTSTTTLFKIDTKGQADSQSEVVTEAAAGTGYAVATGSVSANAEASGEAALKLFEVSTETTKSEEQLSVASTLSVGGDLSAQAQKDVTVQGSDVEAGGDLTLDAENVEVLAGRSASSTQTQRDATSLGIVIEGGISAGAGIGAEVGAGSAVLPFGVGVSADAEVGVAADAAATLGVRNEKETSSTEVVTHTGSTLKAGNNLRIQAEEAIEFVGSSAESGNDLVLEAQDITSTAAQDTTLEKSTQDTHTVGVYVDGTADAQVGASADSQTLRAEAGASANVTASAGLRYQYEGESTTSGSTTQVTSSFKAGNNVVRQAEDEITDQGTRITAGNNIDQSAQKITEIAASDSVFSRTSTSDHDTKVGLQASASAEAGAKASVININGPKAKAEAEVSAGVGVGAKYTGNEASDSISSSTAVTSRYQAGGDISSVSEETTTLIGTDFEAGGNVDLSAGTLDYQAAQNTSSSSATTHDINADARVDVVTITGTPAANIAGGYQGSGSSSTTTEAKVGGITAGGNLNITTKDDIHLEGTQLTAGEDTNIQAGGSVDFTAARSTSESLSQSGGIGGEVGAAVGELSIGVEGNYALEKSASDQAVAGGIQSGGDLNISSGEDITLEGTDLQAQGDIDLAATENVNLKAAKSTESNITFDLSVSVEVGTASEQNPGGTAGATSASVAAGGPCAKPPCTGTAERTTGFDIQTGFGYSEKVNSDVTNIESGSNLSISGKNVVDQEAQLDAANPVQISGDVIDQEAEQKDISVSGRFSLGGEKVEELADKPTSGNSASDKFLDDFKGKTDKLKQKLKEKLKKNKNPAAKPAKPTKPAGTGAGGAGSGTASTGVKPTAGSGGKAGSSTGVKPTAGSGGTASTGIKPTAGSGGTTSSSTGTKPTASGSGTAGSSTGAKPTASGSGTAGSSTGAKPTASGGGTTSSSTGTKPTAGSSSAGSSNTSGTSTGGGSSTITSKVKVKATATGGTTTSKTTGGKTVVTKNP